MGIECYLPIVPNETHSAGSSNFGRLIPRLPGGIVALVQGLEGTFEGGGDNVILLHATSPT